MSKMEGSCLCGSMKYSVDAEPVMSAACHCTQCQKQTGTAYSVILGVPADAVTISGDSLKTFEDTGTSGLPVHRKFCGNCGSPLFTDVKAFEGLLFIKAGALDNTDGVSVGAEIWCDSKKDYATLDEQLPKFPGNPPAG